MIKIIKALGIMAELIINITKKFSSMERPSPHPIIKWQDVKYDRELGVLTISNIPNGWLTTVADTNSMEPMFDYGDILILLPVKIHDNLQVGDVVVYYTGAEQSIIHRIRSIKRDKQGWRHYTLKGDNNLFNDAYDVMDGHIHWIYAGHIVSDKE